MSQGPEAASELAETAASPEPATGPDADAALRGGSPGGAPPALLLREVGAEPGRPRRRLASQTGAQP
jgi:hypothetical protein